MHRTSFLVVGEALVDVVTDATGHPVERPGGSPANVAVGLGRQGLDVQLLTALGADERGALVRAHLEASRVQVLASPLLQTAVARAQLDTEGVATYTFDIGWDLTGAPEPGPADWLHVGSIGATLEPGGTQVLALAHGWPGVVSYDPNCRPLLMDHGVLARMEQLVAASDVVKLSDEDCTWLFPGEDQEVVARRWLDLGPRLVVITRGGRGAQAWTQGRTVWVDTAAGEQVVDTVGAGDAFMAGLIADLSTRDLGGLAVEELHTSLDHASTLARRTCERVGADPPWAVGIVHP